VIPFAAAQPWGFSLERYRTGIDNAHIDVSLSPRLRDQLGASVRGLIQEDLRAQSRRHPPELHAAVDLKSFRESYLGVLAATEKADAKLSSGDGLALLRLSLLKSLLQSVVAESASLQEELKQAATDEDARASGRDREMHESLVALSRDERAVKRRVLRMLFRQLRKLEGPDSRRTRPFAADSGWPFPRRAFFNPVLLVPDLNLVKELVLDYPIARLGESGDTDWLFKTNQCVSTVFQHYLPPWTRLTSHPEDGANHGLARERLDQGLLGGFLGTEMLLSSFVPEEEYRTGKCSWLDEPDNLRLFLASGPDVGDPAGEPRDSTFGYSRESGLADSRFSLIGESVTGYDGPWLQDGWPEFHRAVVDALFRCLELHALGSRIILLYWLRAIGSKVGRPVPLSLVADFVEGRLPRRRLAHRLAEIGLGSEPASVARVLERTASELKRLGSGERARYFRRYLTDFLVLRRDLKLAYKTYEAMDRIRLLDDPQEVQLSHANTSLYEFASGEEQGDSAHPILAHAVIKADVRGSTRITKRLRQKGLNPASHFGLNFFDPVNKLLPEFRAEKLFVEGDAVILGLFEQEGPEPLARAVARACGLARKILQVVFLQNVTNRKHGLPELELGLGISYSSREPNFLYDEGRRIMISGAINRADRLSACERELRSGRFDPENEAFRVSVVRDVSVGSGAVRSNALLTYNVNGINLEQAAFFKLRKEVDLLQVRLPEEEMGDSLFFTASFLDASRREHWLVIRSAPVRSWDGSTLGPVDPEHRRYFEVIVDEVLSARVRKLAEGDDG
jgi:hypothetical protein